MPPISVVIITFNEERNIERCLRSVQDVADEIVVLDSLSTDRTGEICEQYQARFIEQPFLGYVEQKNKALEYATYPHVLSLDADEELSDELKKSILGIKNNWQHDGYCFNRLTNYCGTWVKHCGWYPDRKQRLFDKRKGRWSGDTIHERYLLNDGSAPQHISGDLLHYSYDTIDQHLDQIKKFTTIMAQVQFKKGNFPGLSKLVLNPLWCFIRQYILRLGFLDGYHGLVICVLSACANFVKYSKTRELYANQEQSA
ncbi:MAG TPA: glycosyltransferase family 2 protein [Desulfuromonadales bacterium]|nr:glycosyltransferase family 2 protein [Desulfuromonadales bacterium]